MGQCKSSGAAPGRPSLRTEEENEIDASIHGDAYPAMNPPKLARESSLRAMTGMWKSRSMPAEENDLDASIHGDSYPVTHPQKRGVTERAPTVKRLTQNMSDLDMDMSMHGAEDMARDKTIGEDDFDDVIEYINSRGPMGAYGVSSADSRGRFVAQSVLEDGAESKGV